MRRTPLARVVAVAVLVGGLLVSGSLLAPPAGAAGATTTTLTSSANPSASGQAVTFTATVTSPPDIPTGSVTFQVDGGSDQIVPLDASGMATFSTSSLSVGPHAIAAFYISNSGTFTNSETTLAQQVTTPLATTLALVASANPSVVGEAVTFTATVSASSVPTGSVTFQVDGGNDVVIPLDGSGVAAFTTTTLSLGLHGIGAFYTSDSPVFLDSEQSIAHQVIAAPSSSDTTPSSTAPSSSTTAAVAAAGEELPVTGGPTGAETSAGLGLVAIGAGLLLVAGARRRLRIRS